MQPMSQEAWPHEREGDGSLSKKEPPFIKEMYAFKFIFWLFGWKET